MPKDEAFEKHIGLHGIRSENEIYYPRTTSEIQQLIKFARLKKKTIRTMGSQHSPWHTIFDESSNQICLSLDGDLKKIHSIKPIDTEAGAIVSVGAGCYLGVNPKDKTSNLKNSFNYLIDQAGYALPTLGGISHQTIAGFLQTSSSGGSFKHGIADAIEEIELVNGLGEICRFKKGELGFNAVGVGMGLFGIITNVTFKVRQKFHVEILEEHHKIANSFLKKDSDGHFRDFDKALFEDHEYMHINWFPQKYVNRVMHWTGKAVATDVSIKDYKHPLKSKFITYMAAAILKIGNILENFSSNHWFINFIRSILIKPFVPLPSKKTFCDVWYKALPIDDQADVNGLINTLFSELWFPREQLHTVMRKLEALFNRDPKAIGNFIVECYAAKASPFWMSPAYQRDSFRVDLYWWARNSGCGQEYFTRFWNVLLDVPGVRFHWGKHMPIPGVRYGEKEFNLQFLLEVYPKLNDWLALRATMDPDQIFVNEYWRNMFAISKNLEANPPLCHPAQFLARDDREELTVWNNRA